MAGLSKRHYCTGIDIQEPRNVKNKARYQNLEIRNETDYVKCVCKVCM